MLDLVDQARPSGVADDAPGLFAAPPASLLEPLARATGADGAPLLQFVAEPLWSFDHQARHHARTTAATSRRGSSRASRARIGARCAPRSRACTTPAAAVRAAAYQQVVPQLAGRDAGNDADVRAWLQDSAIIESHLSTLANLEAEAIADRERRRRVRAPRSRRWPRAWRPAVLEATGALCRRRQRDAEVRLAGYRGLAPLVQGRARRR